MVSYDKYLLNALTKAGYVVIVKTCFKNIQKSKLEYISPNAAMLGINCELLMKGLKLTEDYIHPDDRNKVIPAASKALKNHVRDYTHEYRMVGDDGVIYNVSNEIVVSDIDEDTFCVEFYLKKIDNVKPVSHDTVVNDKFRGSAQTSQNANISADVNEKISYVMEVFAKLSNLYSVFVDVNGKPIFPPTGPVTNMGDFYDLLEKPAYKKYYAFMRDEINRINSPVIFDREEGGISKMLAAPVRAGENLKGIWLLGSYTEKETEKLKSISNDHWEIAKILSEYLNQRLLAATDIAVEKGKRVKLENTVSRHSVITNAMDRVDDVTSESIDDIINEILEETGKNLDADRVMLYRANNKLTNEFVLSNYWSGDNDCVDKSISTYSLNHSFTNDHKNSSRKGQYVIDGRELKKEEEIWMLENSFKALVIQPVFLNEILFGIIVFAQTKSERIWTKGEMDFICTMSTIMSQMIKNIHGNDNVRMVNKHLIETYNNFKVGVFIRDTYSGKVLFSNSYMNELVGYDFTGKDSRSILTDLHDKFDNISGMRKPFITQNDITNWRSYISGLDEIMDITEISMEWINEKPASMVILRKAQDV